MRGPLSAGFHTDLWTCRRVAEVVRREFGIAYHPAHLGRILHDLGFSPQKPQRRARERDEAAIQRWRERDWLRIKKRGRRRQATIVFLDETGFVLQPLNRRTWAPAGSRPQQYAWDRHDRLSVIGSLALRSLDRFNTDVVMPALMGTLFAEWRARRERFFTGG